jgi:hypothetical protein
MGKAIPGTDTATFKVLNANFECTADAAHAYFQNVEIAGDPIAFSAGKAATGC